MAARGLKRRFVIIVVAVLGVSALLRAFVMEAHMVSDASGAPSVVIGDLVLVTRYSYLFSEPARGEIIVFKNPDDEDRDLIGRVVALGGDTVAVDRKNRLVINGKRVPRRRVKGPCSFEQVDPDGARSVPCVAYEERPGRSRYRIIHQAGRFPGPSRAVKVPGGHVFVMGDNRNNSRDSRERGTVPLGRIKGRAGLILWSDTHEFGFRRERMFTWLHSD